MGGGIVGLVALDDDTRDLFKTVKDFTVIEIAILVLGALFVYQIYTMVRDAKEEFPAKWNPFKKKEFMKMTPVIRQQLSTGRYMTGLLGPDYNYTFLEQLGNLQAYLRDLDIPYPDAYPGEQGWGDWITFLARLIPYAESGDIEGARVINSSQAIREEVQEKES